jgi:CheY-like chemotaxis protein
MKDIIQWLLKVEHAAGTAYSNALACFNDDPEFNSFLSENAEDEAWHYHVMASAVEHIRKCVPAIPVIAIDEELNKHILGTLTAINERLIQKKLSKEQFLKAMAETEFSEWNDIFIYVVNTLKTNFPEFSVVIPKIQRHKRAIEVYLEKHAVACDKITNLTSLPKLWEEKILIIEDDESVAELLKAILKSEGHVDIAGNGKEGYEKIRQEYYKLIVSDVDMPVMDGIELYNSIINLYPDIGSRYLFITGDVSSKRKIFFDQKNLAFLEKPASVSKIRMHALDILLVN